MELADSKSGVGRDGVHFDAFESLFDEGEVVFGAWQVHFVGDDAPRAFGKFVGIQGDLGAKDFKIGDRVAGFTAGGIDDEHEETAAHDVAQELVAKANIGMGTFDDAGDVCDGGPAGGVELHDADHGLQRCERVAGDFWASCTELGHQRGFARIRKTNEAGVGDGAKFEVEVAFFAGGSGGELAGGLVRCGFEVDVAFATLATLAQCELFADLGEIDDRFKSDFNFTGFGVFFLSPTADQSAGWDFVDDIFGGFAEALFASSGIAIGGMKFGVEEEGLEAVGAVVDMKNDAATAAAISAVGAAFGLEFAAVKVNRTVSAFSGVGMNFDVVDEHYEWARSRTGLAEFLEINRKGKGG